MKKMVYDPFLKRKRELGQSIEELKRFNVEFDLKKKPKRKIDQATAYELLEILETILSRVHRPLDQMVPLLIEAHRIVCKAREGSHGEP